MEKIFCYAIQYRLLPNMYKNLMLKTCEFSDFSIFTIVENYFWAGP